MKILSTLLLTTSISTSFAADRTLAAYHDLSGTLAEIRQTLPTVPVESIGVHVFAPEGTSIAQFVDGEMHADATNQARVNVLFEEACFRGDLNALRMLEGELSVSKMNPNQASVDSVFKIEIAKTVPNRPLLDYLFTAEHLKSVRPAPGIVCDALNTAIVDGDVPKAQFLLNGLMVNPPVPLAECVENIIVDITQYGLIMSSAEAHRDPAINLALNPSPPQAAIDRILLHAALCGHQELVAALFNPAFNAIAIPRQGAVKEALKSAGKNGKLPVIITLLSGVVPLGSRPQEGSVNDVFLQAGHNDHQGIVEYLLNPPVPMTVRMNRHGVEDLLRRARYSGKTALEAYLKSDVVPQDLRPDEAEMFREDRRRESQWYTNSNRQNTEELQRLADEGWDLAA